MTDDRVDEPLQAGVLVEWWPSASIGETNAVRHLIEGWCGRLMTELLAMGVVDPTVELSGPPASPPAPSLRTEAPSRDPRAVGGAS